MIPIRLLTPTARLPEQATPGSAAYDLFLDSPEPIELHPRQTVLCSTGISLALDTGLAFRSYPNQPQTLETFPRHSMCALILPRSGLGCRGIKPSNSPGLIDPDYRGEILVCLTNDGSHYPAPFTINPGERIAQILFVPYLTPGFFPVDEDFNPTDRSTGGFGSTGA